MNCADIPSDQLLAPTAAVSEHIFSCDACNERQRAVILAQRALAALAGEPAFPEKNDAAIRAAIPALAAAASRRRPASWWQVAAAAAVLCAAVGGALQFAGKREEPGPAPAEVASKGEESRKPVIEEVKPPTPEPHTDPVKTPDPVPGPKVTPPDPGPPEVAHKDPPPPDPIPFPPPPDPAPPIIVKGPKIEDSSIADSMLIMKGLLGEAEAIDRDYNGDGVTDIADAMLAARHAAQEESPR